VPGQRPGRAPQQRAGDAAVAARADHDEVAPKGPGGGQDRLRRRPFGHAALTGDASRLKARHRPGGGPRGVGYLGLDHLGDEHARAFDPGADVAVHGDADHVDPVLGAVRQGQQQVERDGRPLRSVGGEEDPHRWAPSAGPAAVRQPQRPAERSGGPGLDGPAALDGRPRSTAARRRVCSARRGVAATAHHRRSSGHPPAARVGSRVSPAEGSKPASFPAAERGRSRDPGRWCRAERPRGSCAIADFEAEGRSELGGAVLRREVFAEPNGSCRQDVRHSISRAKGRTVAWEMRLDHSHSARREGRHAAHS